MKPILITMLFVCFCGYFATAQVKVLAPIVPNGSTDSYPTHYDIFGQGGYMSFPTATDMKNLPDQRKKAGMLVYVVQDDAFFQWDASVPPGAWKQITSLGAASSSSLIWKGNLSAVPGGTPLAGWAYHNTTDNTSYIYNGTTSSWDYLGQNGSFIQWQGQSTTDPAGAQLNWAYFNTNTNTSYIYDGTSWKPFASAGNSFVWKGNTRPNPAQLNWAYYDAGLHQTMIYDGALWQTLAQDGAPGADGLSIIWQPDAASHPNPAQKNWAYHNTTDKISYIYDGANWQTLVKDGGASSLSPFNGSRPITNPAPNFSGVNPNTNDIAKWLEMVFYPTQGPTAALTATGYGVTNSSNIVLEQMGAGTTNITLNWTAGKQGSTDMIEHVKIDGNDQTFTDPAQGSSTSGSLTAPVTNNTDKTFNLAVSTHDLKTSNASASITFQWKRYWGFVDTHTTDNEVYVATNTDLLALNSEFGTSKNFSKSVPAPVGSPQKLIIAFPTAWNVTPAQIIAGGFESTGAFIKQNLTFTNASSGTTSYDIYVQKYNTNGGINFTVQ